MVSKLIYLLRRQFFLIKKMFWILSEDKNILQIEIQMNHILRMEVLHSSEYFTNHISNLHNTKALLAFHKALLERFGQYLL